MSISVRLTIDEEESAPKVTFRKLFWVLKKSLLVRKTLRTDTFRCFESVLWRSSAAEGRTI